MRHFMTTIFLCIVSFASAQIVNIPDPVFKQALLNYNPVIDTNGDGEIQLIEALAITDLIISANDFTGIQSFANLQTINLTDSTTAAVDLSNMLQLKKVTVQGHVHSINVLGCNSLESLIYTSDNLSSGLENMLLGHLPKLTYLKIAQTSVTGTVDLTGCDSLKTLDFGQTGDTFLRSLDISGLTKLDTLTLSGSYLVVKAANCVGLTTINYFNFSRIYNVLELGGCINLKSIDIRAYDATMLDLSSCINLKSLIIKASYQLHYLDLKNGTLLDTAHVEREIGAGLLNVCADDFEVNWLVARLTQPVNDDIATSLMVTPYCTFYPGGAYNTMNGTIKLDLNNNGCDGSDAGMPNVPVRYRDTSGQSTINYSAATGDYFVYATKGIFTVQPYFPYAYFSISPASANVSFDTANNLISTNNFCISPAGIHNDLSITCLPLSRARPGQNAVYQIIYKNSGTTILSGNVKLNFDNSKMSFVASTVTVSSQSPGQLDWTYANLQPFESKIIKITFNLLPPPVNNNNDTLIYVAAIDPVAGDETPGDNSFILPQSVTTSYDPNDKQCLEGSKIEIASLNKPLHYIIHFQNLGTDTAFTIVVADTLTNNVDWESFNFIGSSHPCHTTRKNNKLEFYFENIRLPYQAINDAGSTGFVAFDVKPKNTLVVGDSINNTASIYFDFNFPVLTNMASTVVVPTSPLAVKLEYFSVRKKDETNVLDWKASSTSSSTNFGIERSGDGIHFANLGGITATAERCQAPFNFTDEKPLTGKNYYRLKITDADGLSFYSKILEIGNNKSGIEITAVTSDGNNTILYLNALKEQTLQLKIIATDGRIVYAQSKAVVAGNNAINLQLRNLPKGVYSLVLYTSEGEIITKRFVR